MNITSVPVISNFCRMANDGWQQGWHERNGGNLSYRLTQAEADQLRPGLNFQAEWKPIGVSVPGLAWEFFIVTGSGKYFRNVLPSPEDSICIIQINQTGDFYRILWGMTAADRPTSELPTHLMNHEVKKAVTNNTYRVIYHAHPANIIALSFVLPLDSAVFSRELWETMTECPIIFPAGVGVVPWMVPGGRDIAIVTAKLMETYDVAVWAHHGLFCSGSTFDSTFGLMHTVEKAAEILIKIKSVADRRAQTITPDDFRKLAQVFNVILPEEFLK